MTERSQGQPGADRAVGRPGPAARMEAGEGGASATTATATRPEVPVEHEPQAAPADTGGRKSDRPRTSVLISPVATSSTTAPPTTAPPAPASSGSTPAPSAAPTAAAARGESTGAGRPGSKADAVSVPPVAKQGGKPASAGAPPKGSANQAPPSPAARAGKGSKPASGGTSPAAGATAQAAAGAAAASTAVSGAARGAAAKVRKSQVGRLAKTAVQGKSSARSARLYLTHVDPWSVMKQAFLLSLVLAVITLVAFAAIWLALDSAGVLDAITRTATDVGGESGANVSSFLDFSKVMGVALVIAGFEAILVTALATLFAFLYNLAVAIGGGIELTLSEDA